MAEIEQDEIMEYFAELRDIDKRESEGKISRASGDDASDAKSAEDTAGDTSANDSQKDEVTGAEKVRMEVFDWVQCFVTALICGILIFIFIGRTIGVEGNSMMDTLHNTDRVIMHNVFYTPKKGDIVVFQSFNEDRFHDVPLVKRVIATAGDTIEIDFDTGDVKVNGEVIFEPYIYTVTTSSEGFEGLDGPIPEGFIFVMGDNRNNSIDSRSSDVGLIDTRYVLGRVVFLLIPGMENSGVRDWSRFGVVS